MNEQELNHQELPQDDVQLEQTLAAGSDATPQQSQQETDADRNFKRLREAKDKLEREKNELSQRLASYEAPQRQQVVEEEDDDIGIGAEEIVEGRHLNRYRQEIKDLKKEIKQFKETSTLQTTEARLKSQYNDFERVVTADNIALLKEMEPELSDSINTSSNLYSKAVSAYKLIKQLGIYKDDSMYSQDKERVVSNTNKPRPTTAVSAQKGSSPLSQANSFAQGLTKELKDQLMKEMHEARKAY